MRRQSGGPRLFIQITAADTDTVRERAVRARPTGCGATVASARAGAQAGRRGKGPTMKKPSNPTIEAFDQLELEMQEKFAALASNFDFFDAEQKAIESLNEVYRLADRARAVLDEAPEFQPQHKVVCAQQYDDLFAKYMTIECELRTFFASVGYNPAARGSASSKTNPARTNVPAAALERLFEAFDFTKINHDGPQHDEGQGESDEQAE